MFCFTDAITYSDMYFINNFAHIFQMNKFIFEYVKRYTYFYKQEVYIKMKNHKISELPFIFYQINSQEKTCIKFTGLNL